ncbi:hypothetical protein LRS10_16935 [Phenylobacterium sp. J426]|uniref:hypothetical protein n=1 Tax=Phenylobacterium sp. J426 TaxID=2898439 RepID=UPI002150C97B|nr:hypothetical protein [Phenylobacterium sp. J426]MCR5875703.1 hypothetical protein [Phenylobacterium sp. J426]
MGDGGEFGLGSVLVHTSGAGREYEVREPQAWWRDFAEVAPHDERRAVSFVQRRGDPAGVLSPTNPVSTTAEAWVSLRALLRAAARAWEPGRENAESRYGHGGVSPSDAVREFLGALGPGWTDELSVTYDGLQPVTVARTLRAFMLASAMASLRHRAPMRWCAYCHSWFHPARTDARFDTASCRAAFANRRSSPHGVASQDKD